MSTPSHGDKCPSSNLAATWAWGESAVELICDAKNGLLQAVSVEQGKTNTSLLFELSQQQRWADPTWSDFTAVGPPHAPRFEVTVTVHRGSAMGIAATGEGKTKSAAQHAAAAIALLQALPTTSEPSTSQRKLWNMYQLFSQAEYEKASDAGAAMLGTRPASQSPATATPPPAPPAEGDGQVAGESAEGQGANSGEGEDGEGKESEALNLDLPEGKEEGDGPRPAPCTRIPAHAQIVTTELLREVSSLGREMIEGESAVAAVADATPCTAAAVKVIQIDTTGGKEYNSAKAGAALHRQVNKILHDHFQTHWRQVWLRRKLPGL